MKPTIGRIVHYHHEFGYPGQEGKLKTLAAIITDVRPIQALIEKDSDVVAETALEVDLFIFGQVSPDRSNSTRAIPFSMDPKSGHWSWPAKV